MAWYIEGLSLDARYAPHFELEEKPSGYIEASWLQATPIPRQSVPLSARIRSTHKSLPDFFAVYAIWVVCQKFRDMAESLEPGKHEFFSIKLLRRSNDQFEGRFYLLNVLQKLDAIIVEKSEASWRSHQVKLPDGTIRESKVLSVGPRPQLTLRRPIVDGHHLWRGDQHTRNKVFFSDALMDLVSTAKLKKLRAFHANEE